MVVYNKIREIVRSIILYILGTFAKPAPYIYILGGHVASFKHDNESDGKKFAEMLSVLHRYCDFVNFQDAVEMIENKVAVKKPTLAFSFDDGWRDCYTQLCPKIEKYGVNAICFVNPNAADAMEKGDEEYIKHFTEEVTLCPGKRPMTWDQMKDLQNRGFLIGAHTMDHYCINDDNEEELSKQIGDCKKVIKERLGSDCDYFAFPFGKLSHANERSIDIAHKYYKYVFSQWDYRHYFSYNGKVINRRHFESFWPIKHVLFFLSVPRK